MPAIQIRPLDLKDLPILIKIDHSYLTEHVWQMEFRGEIKHVEISFKERRLPRPVKVEYPRDPYLLADVWDKRPGILVAELAEEPIGEPVGYINLLDGIVPGMAQVTDIAVVKKLRRKGIGAGLLLAAQDWALERGNGQLLIEIQSKNYPGICLAQKVGFEFCGYSDRYYPNQDIALFFAKPT
jgi:ribosomal protein S18 acetylase RimI-like enzyme